MMEQTKISAQLKGHVKVNKRPPRIATRGMRGPLLLKCHPVVYDVDTNRLRLPHFMDCRVRRVTKEEDYDEEEYENTVIGGGESDWADDFTDEDSRILEKIKKLVLIPIKNREERKVRINKYLNWFKEALTEGEKKLKVSKPLTDEDCDFLQAIHVAALPSEDIVDLESFPDEKLQGYAIAFKFISDLSDEAWDEVEKAWTESKQDQE